MGYLRIFLISLLLFLFIKVHCYVYNVFFPCDNAFLHLRPSII